MNIVSAPPCWWLMLRRLAAAAASGSGSAPSARCCHPLLDHPPLHPSHHVPQKCCSGRWHAGADDTRHSSSKHPPWSGQPSCSRPAKRQAAAAGPTHRTVPLVSLAKDTARNTPTSLLFCINAHRRQQKACLLATAQPLNATSPSSQTKPAQTPRCGQTSAQPCVFLLESCPPTRADATMQLHTPALHTHIPMIVRPRGHRWRSG